MITVEFLISALGKSSSPRDFLFLLLDHFEHLYSPFGLLYSPISFHSMFAHFVTAAKGLFTRQPEEQESYSSTSTDNPKMVTTTRQGKVTPEVATSGKRKAQSASAGKTEAQQTKRIRRSDPMAGADHATKNTPGKTSQVKTEKAPAGKKIRFDSEEPEQFETQAEEISETPNPDDDEDDSDDDAPETINNSAQLLKMKEQAKKQEAAKQLYV